MHFASEEKGEAKIDTLSHRCISLLPLHHLSSLPDRAKAPSLNCVRDRKRGMGMDHKGERLAETALSGKLHSLSPLEADPMTLRFDGIRAASFSLKDMPDPMAETSNSSGVLGLIVLAPSMAWRWK
jgi:hypothetical protein